MNGRDWVRLADYVINRRTELRFDSQDALSEAADVSLKTINRLEQGTSVSSTTLGKIERALRWAPGSVRAVLAGGPPTEQPEPEAEPIEPIDPVRERLLRNEFAELSRKYGKKRALKLIDEVVAEFRETEPLQDRHYRSDERGRDAG